MKVDLVILGAQKCATSSMFEILCRHPRIVGSLPKEPHFFSTARDWRAELPRYEAIFPPARDDALRLEASTSYTFYPHRNLRIWEDMYEYNPGLRFLYLVRDPIDRIVSQYMHSVARGYTREPIERVITRHPLYLDATRYATQITPFIETFGRDQVLIVDFEDFVGAGQETLARVMRFVGLDPSDLAEHEEVHANRSVGGAKQHHLFDDPALPLRALRHLAPRTWKRLATSVAPTIERRPELSPAHQQMIVDMLEFDIRELEVLLGKDLTAWRRTPRGTGPRA